MSKTIRRMTYPLAMTIGFDEGNRHAGRHVRKVWTAEDFDHATRKVDELLETDPTKFCSTGKKLSHHRDAKATKKFKMHLVNN